VFVAAHVSLDARNVRYRDRATADPPNKTLTSLPPNGMIVWAVIFNPAQSGAKPIRLNLSRAKHFACCEGASLAAGNYELTGSGPGSTYSVIVRIYFGSRPRTPSVCSNSGRGLSWIVR
jgi:hypothetical protein